MLAVLKSMVTAQNTQLDNEIVLVDKIKSKYSVIAIIKTPVLLSRLNNSSEVEVSNVKK